MCSTGAVRACEVHMVVDVYVLYSKSEHMETDQARQLMDALQFGRWVGERRRRYGWGSQRALVEAVRHTPRLSEYSISEDFLARLEAGQLVHPFRGSARERVLVLTELLCKTPHELNAYLRAAELTRLNADETAYVTRLGERLTAQHSHAILLLPPRPTRLLGRTSLLDELVKTLSTVKTGVCAVTGMPGVGKSALAFETVHRLAAQERERPRLFPDGIVAFTCTGRRGIDGLVAVLHEIAEVFSPAAKPAPAAKAATLVHTTGSAAPSNGNHTLPTVVDIDLAGAIDCVRIALADKHLALVLDDLDAQFPLRQALEALLSSGPNSTLGQTSRVVLTTSCYVPAPALLAHHLHVGPLEPDAALELFTTLLGRSLYGEERVHAEQVCAAIGYLPLAIGVAASAMTTRGIPLSLLATRAAEFPLDMTLDGEYEISSRLAQALESFEPEMQRQFALLATLGRRSFALERAAAIRTSHPEAREARPGMFLSGHTLTISHNNVYHDTAHAAVDLLAAQLARTAADLGLFVRHSLVELVPSPASGLRSASNSTHYRLHPLLYAHAMERLEQLEPEVAHTGHYRRPS